MSTGHLMLAHLRKNRESDKFRGFNYRKIIVDSEKMVYRGCVPSKVIAWEVTYKDNYLAQFKNLKQVKEFIRVKANT